MFFNCGALYQIPNAFATSGDIFGGNLKKFHFRQNKKTLPLW